MASANANPVVAKVVLSSTPSSPRKAHSRAVLGRAKDFLGEMAKANDKLQLDVKDLLLGVADLHSEKGVEVAEATMNGFPPTGRSFTCSSSDSEDDSDDSDEDDGDEQNMSAKDEDESETQTSKRKEAQ
ncbi:uncharacterized protein LOC102715107 isoform X2 [Oryza brachyantha]|uniref:uncharacterized protein LOC102715107 isoform X2 n=1 Tax=Oryza brachyantha TaxID=4533 RepID=UPI000776ACE9|nr:uncharacterized protein LOC102715107 isoform X2 [Oryza brachyantha]